MSSPIMLLHLRKIIAVLTDNKIPNDAELTEFLKNKCFEDRVVIEGLARIPDEVMGKAWQ